MLPDDLLRPEAWPEPRPAAVELLQTHVSWILRGDREVFKIKKPVRLGFLDFGTPALRRAACEAEVVLNARLSPDVYRGIVPIVSGPGGTLAIGAEGPGVDWAVRMRRLRDEDRADVRLAEGRLDARDVDVLAPLVASFHERCRVDAAVASRWASPQAVERNVRENFDQTRAFGADLVPPEVAAEAEQRQLAFVREHAELLRARLDGGRVRDGHGDLRLEHIYLEPDGVRIIDCIEFDPRYRVSDAAADVAFLAMDLAAHGRADLAERWLGRYARAADDYDLYAVEDFYAGYRAWVRGKVAALLAQDRGAPDAVRRQAARDARRLFLLARATTRAPLVRPTLVCVGGLIASGKSTIADALSSELSCPVVDADRTRKHLLGVAETRPLHDPMWSGAYDPRVTERVYEEILRRAEIVLRSGRSVVLDASFRSVTSRRRARELAARHRVSFRFVECAAPADVCRARLEQRARAPGPSDGRPAVFDDFAARFEAVSELPPSEHFRLDTTRPLDASRDEMRAHVTTWPRGLEG